MRRGGYRPLTPTVVCPLCGKERARDQVIAINPFVRTIGGRKTRRDMRMPTVRACSTCVHQRAYVDHLVNAISAAWKIISTSEAGA